MYDEPMMAEGSDKPGKSLAKRIAEIEPQLHIYARVDSYGGGPPSDYDHLKERHARVKKEIAALENEITNFDEKAAIMQIRRSLTADLAHKRADLMECEADLEAAGVDYDGGGADESDEDEGDESDASAADETEDEDGAVMAKGN